VPKCGRGTRQNAKRHLDQRGALGQFSRPASRSVQHPIAPCGPTDRTFKVDKVMQARIWLGILIGSTIGGFVPALWGGDLISYAGVLLSGIGAIVGLWVGYKSS
jgi:predicted MFS family arabinose efflux permease